MIKIEIPIKTISEANCSEHWTKKSKRHKQQQFFVRLAFKKLENAVNLPCIVKIIRMGPGTLDKEDNLPMSLKWVKDQIADCLIPGLAKGRADDDERITWKYDQRRSSKYGVEIQIRFDA